LFSDCFLVNNFDLEIKHIWENLQGKRIVHFVNRLLTAPLEKENYRKLSISEIQLCRANHKLWQLREILRVRAMVDKPFLTAIRHYESLGLRTVYLPHNLTRESHKKFGNAFRKKFPNTGLAAIWYALNILQPQKLYIAGLDFYQQDYLCRRAHQNPLKKQQEKMNQIAAPDIFQQWVQAFPNIHFTISTYYKGLKPALNLTVL
jgi:hypothetical protein